MSENQIVTTAENRPACVDQNPAVIYVATLGSEVGRQTMRQALALAANKLQAGANVLTFNWAALRYQHVAAVRSALQAEYKPATINKVLAALKGTLRAAWQSGQMSAEDYQKAVSVKGVRGETLPAGRKLSSGELAALLAACEDDKSRAGVRDAAIIATMYCCGLRRAEVITLDYADYDAEAGQLKIKGKGKKERIAFLPVGAAEALAEWLAIRGDQSGALFVAVNKGGALGSNRPTTQAIYNMLQKRADAAGVKAFSPHDLRRTFVSDLLDAGADITTVSRMAGHASVTTTARYDRRGDEVKRKAASLLHVPYRGRAK